MQDIYGKFDDARLNRTGIRYIFIPKGRNMEKSLVMISVNTGVAIGASQRAATYGSFRKTELSDIKQFVT
jgi:hypothetical protein